MKAKTPVAIIAILAILAMLVLLSCSKLEKASSDNKVNSAPTTNLNNTTYEIRDLSYKDKKVLIKYPQVTGLTDKKKQMRVNDLLKKEALVALYKLYGDSEKLSMEINFKVMWKSPNLLSIKYYGFGFSEGAPYPNDLLYTINIDMNKGCKIRLKDYININHNFVDIFKKYKVKNPEKNQLSSGAYNYVLSSSSVDDLIEAFNGADSSYDETYTFSYFTKDAVVISKDVLHAAGDHTEIELKYQELKDNINTKSKIWRDFFNKTSFDSKHYATNKNYGVAPSLLKNDDLPRPKENTRWLKSLKINYPQLYNMEHVDKEDRLNDVFFKEALNIRDVISDRGYIEYKLVRVFK